MEKRKKGGVEGGGSEEMLSHLQRGRMKKEIAKTSVVPQSHSKTYHDDAPARLLKLCSLKKKNEGGKKV